MSDVTGRWGDRTGFIKITPEERDQLVAAARRIAELERRLLIARDALSDIFNEVDHSPTLITLDLTIARVYERAVTALEALKETK